LLQGCSSIAANTSVFVSQSFYQSTCDPLLLIRRYCLHKHGSGYCRKARLWSDNNSSPAMLRQAADSQAFAVHVKALQELPMHKELQLAAAALLH